MSVDIEVNFLLDTEYSDFLLLVSILMICWVLLGFFYKEFIHFI